MALYKENTLYVYNSLKGFKEVFHPTVEGRVGMYVCGPTVYSNVHLGNCRTFMSFDMMFRICKNLRWYEKIIIKLFKNTFIKVYNKTRERIVNCMLL